MAAPVAAFQDIRTAKESPAGTKVDAATARLLGTLTCPLGGPILHRPEETRASLIPNFRTVVVGEDLPLHFEGDCTFEQLIYLLHMGIIAKTTPAAAGAYYSWAFNPSLTTANTPGSLTFQFGNNIGIYDVEYVVARSLEISGRMNEAMVMKADMFGRNFEVTTFDPVVAGLASPTTLQSMLTNKTRLYINPAGGTIGDTEAASTLREFSWKLDTGYRPGHHGGANNYYDTIWQDKIRQTVDMTVEFNTAMEAERVIHQAGTGRLFRLTTTGSAGCTFNLYFSGVYTAWPYPEAVDGSLVCRITVEGQYDTVWTTYQNATVVNAVSTLP